MTGAQLITAWRCAWTVVLPTDGPVPNICQVRFSPRPLSLGATTHRARRATAESMVRLADRALHTDLDELLATDSALTDDDAQRIGGGSPTIVAVRAGGQAQAPLT